MSEAPLPPKSLRATRKPVGNADFKVALAVLGLLAAVEIGWLLFMHNFHRWPVVRPAQQAKEVRDDPYWAAKTLLRDKGLKVEELDELAISALPETDRTLVILDQRLTLGRRSTDDLLAWVAQGGHLVVVAQRPTSPTDRAERGDEEEDDEEDEELEQKDLLLESLGIGVEHGLAGPLDVWRSRLWPEKVTVRLVPNPSIAFYYASDEATEQVGWEVADENNARVIHIEHGEGAVTIWPSSLMITNAHLREGDNVWLLWETATTHDERPVVWAPQLEVLSLAQVVWGKGWPLIVALVLWVAVFLAARAPRFGPPLPDPEPKRRSLLEHIEAGAQLLWHHQGIDRLLDACQAAVRRKASHRVAGWSRLSAAEQKKCLATLASMTLEEVEFGFGLARDARDFTERVRCLERMRTRL